MANVQYYDVILKPVITEKSMNAMSREEITPSWYIRTQTRTMIKEAVEKMFPGTKVDSVNTMNCQGQEAQTWNDRWKDRRYQESDR